MFAKRTSGKNKSKRKRQVEDNEDVEDEVILSAPSNLKKKMNSFSTSGASKRSEELIAARKIQSERGIVPQSYAGDATYESQIDTSKDRDARAILERNIELNKQNQDSAGTKLYRGQAGYKNYITKDEAQVGKNKYTGTQGPIRAQTWARSICRFDYQPDICKDYKETGFCGYGDSCKFLHDRGDYKSGWQMEMEFKEQEKKRQQRLAEGMDPEADNDDNKYVIESSDEDEKDACTICREPFRNAVETLCNHVFCEECALKQYKKKAYCFNCGKPTNGVFNAAERFRQREEKSKAEAVEFYEDDGESKQSATSKISGGSWAVVS